VRPDHRIRVVGSQIDGRSFCKMRACGIWAMTMLCWSISTIYEKERWGKGKGRRKEVVMRGTLAYPAVYRDSKKEYSFPLRFRSSFRPATWSLSISIMSPQFHNQEDGDERKDLHMHLQKLGGRGSS
jgi:hypothetical protein